jgi:hypothetical protein
VLDGTVAFGLEGQEQAGGAGGFLLVPRGAAHTFGSGGEAVARLLVLHAPAMDAYYRHAARVGDEPSGQPPPLRPEAGRRVWPVLHIGCPGGRHRLTRTHLTTVVTAQAGESSTLG